MKVTTISCTSGNVIYRLEPSEGFKNVTDGIAICPIAFVGQDADVDRWYDTNEEPPSDEPGEPNQI